MAIKNDLLGGTDWVDAEVLEADDLNDTINATYNQSRPRLKSEVLDTNVSGVTSTSYTTIHTIDTSSENTFSINSEFCLHAYSSAAGQTAYWRILVTLSDASTEEAFTDSVSVSGGQTRIAYRNIYYNAPAGKTITQIELQAKVSAGTVEANYFNGYDDFQTPEDWGSSSNYRMVSKVLWYFTD